jgi:hypothetical protein
MSRARLERFVGNGNVWVGRQRGWQIKCSHCPTTKTITSHGNASLPPAVIVKKLEMTGWNIGNKAADDICRECQRRPTKPLANIEFAKKALAGIVAPMVGTNGHRIQFDELVSIAKSLEPDRARELIRILRETLPAKPPPKEKTAKPPPEPETEYQRWLAEQG